MATIQNPLVPLNDGSGRYYNPSTMQIIDPSVYTSDQRRNMGLPEATTQFQPNQASQPGGRLNFGSNPKESQKHFLNIFGDSPSEYDSAFVDAYENLGQPSSAMSKDVMSNGVYSLADTFINRILSKTGKLPSEDNVRQFVAGNLNSSFAEKFIRGIPTDKIISDYVDPYLAEKPDLLVDPEKQANEVKAEENRILGLNKQLDELYNIGKTQASQDIEDAYGLQKRNVVNDLAGQGMIGQPTSRLTLNELEASKGKSMSQALASLAGERARGSLDLSSTIENLLANERRAGEASRQFGLDYGLRKRATSAAEDESAFNRRLANKQLDLASRLGKMQADASKPNLFSGILGGATAGATLGTGKAGPGWGTAIGGGVGGLAGLLASLR